MENSYGIGVRNRYELFYDEEVDPLDIIKQSENKKRDKIAEKENKGKTTKTKDTIPVKKTALKTETGTKQTIEKTSPTGISKPQQKPLRNNERVKFSDREERNNRRNKPEEVKENIREPRESREPREPREPRENGVGVGVPQSQRFDGEARGRGTRGGFRGGRGGRRGGRGGPGMSGGDFRGKREFDRQSGMVTSSVKSVDKREGSGPFNWGSDKDQIEEQQLQVDQNDPDTSGENPEKPAGEEAPSAPADDEAPKEEEEQKEMTLDEWKALQKRDKPIFKVRRAGEGENTAQWKKTYVLKKKVKENDSDEEEEEEEEEEEVHHGRKKVLLPIDFQFADTPTRGRGRGRGRGGPGGRGRGMGGGRGRGTSRFQMGGSRQEAPKMDDERDFPSLG